MTPDQNKNFVQQLFDEVMNGHNLSAVGKYIAPGFTHHGVPGTKGGPDGFAATLQTFFDGFPDMHVQPESVIAEGDTVVTRGYMTGTHKGTFMGIPGTGKQIRIDYIDAWKIQNDKAIENWVQMDTVGLMQQIGAMPAPATA